MILVLEVTSRYGPSLSIDTKEVSVALHSTPHRRFNDARVTKHGFYGFLPKLTDLSNFLQNVCFFH